MADPITDERLLEIAKHGIASDVSESEVRYCAAKLVNARAEVERLRGDLEFQKSMTGTWAEIIRNQRKEAKGLRRDLKEAVYLLGWYDFDDEENPKYCTVEEREIFERRRKLLARHKETP